MSDIQMAHHHQPQKHGSISSYLIGFLLSIIFTMLAYIPVVIHQNSLHEVFSHELLIPLVLIFAIAQLIVQLVFFLHVWQESRPKWNFSIFLITISLVLLVVIGSLWIMSHLNYNMTPKEMNTYILHQEGMKK